MELVFCFFPPHLVVASGSDGQWPSTVGIALKRCISVALALRLGHGPFVAHMDVRHRKSGYRECAAVVFSDDVSFENLLLHFPLSLHRSRLLRLLSSIILRLHHHLHGIHDRVQPRAQFLRRTFADAYF